MHAKPQVVFLENVKGFVGHDTGRTFKVVMSLILRHWVTKSIAIAHNQTVWVTY
jgi:hypothetical protein